MKCSNMRIYLWLALVTVTSCEGTTSPGPSPMPTDADAEKGGTINLVNLFSYFGCYVQIYQLVLLVNS